MRPNDQLRRLLPALAAVAAVAVAGLLCGSFSSARAAVSAGTAGQIVFYANVSDFVPGTKRRPNPPTVRPISLLEHADGSWVIFKLHWSSWGGSTAHATGISSASDCKPSCANGKRTHDPAQLALSNPKPRFGHTVYTCFQLTIPAAPRANQHECLTHSFGRQWGYSPASGAPVSLPEFLSPDEKIWCVLSNRPGLRTAFCGTNPANRGVAHAAQLSPAGLVQLCNKRPLVVSPNGCLQGWNYIAPVLQPGQRDVIYVYRCTAAVSSVTCVVTSGPGKGHGFRVSSNGATKISG